LLIVVVPPKRNTSRSIWWSQFQAIELLRRHRRFSLAETISVLHFGLQAIFAA